MIEVGARVQVNYPEYASGMRGTIQAKEPSGRWIVEIDVYSWVLSLDESDFEVITNPPET